MWWNTCMILYVLRLKFAETSLVYLEPGALLGNHPSSTLDPVGRGTQSQRGCLLPQRPEAGAC